MFPTALPFDYAVLVDRGDRTRAKRARMSDCRLRRATRRGEA